MLSRRDVQLEAALGAGIGAGRYVATSRDLAGHRGLLCGRCRGSTHSAPTLVQTTSTRDDAQRRRTRGAEPRGAALVVQASAAEGWLMLVGAIRFYGSAGSWNPWTKSAIERSRS